MNEEQRKQKREYMRAYRVRTNLAHDHKYYEKNKEKRKAYRESHKEYYDGYNNRRIKFKGKYVLIPKRFKTGICSDCGKSVKKGELPYTVAHHIQYDSEHPEQHTIELCISCHRKRHIIEYSMTKVAIRQREYRAKLKERKA